MLKVIGGLTLYGFALFGVGVYLTRIHGAGASRH
jgi:hypothetical protein